jgi:hypothetical protein
MDLWMGWQWRDVDAGKGKSRIALLKVKQKIAPAAAHIQQPLSAIFGAEHVLDPTEESRIRMQEPISVSFKKVPFIVCFLRWGRRISKGMGTFHAPKDVSIGMNVLLSGRLSANRAFLGRIHIFTPSLPSFFPV